MRSSDWSSDVCSSDLLYSRRSAQGTSHGMERTCRRVRMRRASAAFPKGYHGCDRERFDRLVRACCAMTGQLQAPFEGVLELDETTFGGARKGKRGWCAAGEVAVLGLIKRNGQAKIMPIAAHDRA